MKIGKGDNPENIDFSIPADDVGTIKVLSENENKNQLPEFRVGYAKQNKTGNFLCSSEWRIGITKTRGLLYEKLNEEIATNPEIPKTL